ncbi:DUF1064 domain-containing protein [Anaerostipes hadrus]|jgi:hypothetical protein|uniref:DUF1064 domain-containing protein n=1 Tax=Anaerostipes hadrus TaxID=649756 RepID=A0ABX2I3D7_ANAHA|nr:DUF1064 domain-containing protein [Anaerostipes hadrus]OKZ65327.1 MAG: hypothetical protein BHV88_18505 [Clostridiales bacterium 41_12_two_minus]MCQ4782817.1 DUF1064 domain-containing protein [Anaerostipes hadrus]NSG58984.1 DUF1064 domain-containing protein [Anaerostipes hadrus]NSG80677.1 DUF1064 domain-containing protein [Anaerostipes hadrus]NSG99887.1 DUF1064 domain-containing protein [Anaerostipes hadrus]
MAWKNYNRPNKYNNHKTIVDGIKFDSIREAERYQELKLLEEAGEISHLELQPVVVLQDKFIYQGKTIRAITYRGDFAYFDRRVNRGVIEDVKGVETDVFKIKKKMFQKKYGDLYDLRITR